MDKKKLIELAKKLNAVKDKDGNLLLTNKVKFVAVSNDVLVASFLDACESIPEEKEELLPDDVAEAYNELVNEDPRSKEKAEAPAKEKSEKEEKKGKKKSEETTKETKKKSAKSEDEKEEVKPEKKSVKKETKKSDEVKEKKVSDRSTQKYSHFIFCKKELVAGKKEETIKQHLVERLEEEGRKHQAAVLRAGEILKIMKIALED